MTVFDRSVPTVSMTDESNWYALRPEIRSGALRFSELLHLVGSNQLRADDLIWHVGWAAWVNARDVPQLFAAWPSATIQVNGQGQRAPEIADNKQARRSELKARAKREMRSYLVITAYAWTILLVLRLHELIVLGDRGLDLESHGLLIVKALIMGKVILIAEALHVGERFKSNVPVYSILIKSIM